MAYWFTKLSQNDACGAFKLNGLEVGKFNRALRSLMVRLSYCAG